MIFATPEEAIAYVKANAGSTPKWVTNARNYSKELKALIGGKGFLDELIQKIEYVESEEKFKARKKYSRNMRSMFERLSLPIQNVFSATGAVKDYQNGEVKLSEANQAKLLSILGNVRDNKSLERYIESKWLPLYHTDPAGVLFVQYKKETQTDGEDELCVYPTYQSINVIRTYIDDGQLVENILFEPKILTDGTKQWVLVDDANQYTINQKGDIFSIVIDDTKTFPHPFGEVPVVIISNITDEDGVRLSPFDVILDDSKEYARDLSMKTILKAIHGSPKHWRREAICASCHGTRKSGDQNCPQCSPTGKTAKSDVTDVAVLPFDPNNPIQLKGDDIMGIVMPATETWKAFAEELEQNENLMHETMWGVSNKSRIKKPKTATEVIFEDTQPMIQKLNKYADVAEWIEWTITEWIANIVDLTKPKEESISLIVYGRRYILEGIDAIQQKYEDAKDAGENTVVLDSIFDELLTVKFKNDVEWLKIELKKARVEPYLHNSTDQINTYFGAKEVARKIYFQDWWKNLSGTELQMEAPALRVKFNTDFKTYLPTVELITPVVATPALGGGPPPAK